MTSKLQALLSAACLAVAGFINWLATVPPSQQEGWTAALVEMVPISWRPNVGLFTRFLMLVSTVYMAHKASQSGPQSPPRNKPE